MSAHLSAHEQARRSPCTGFAASSFHAPTERLLSTLVARRFVESFFGRLDARTASLPATVELMAHHFPGDYRLLSPGVDTEQDLERVRALYAQGKV